MHSPLLILDKDPILNDKEAREGGRSQAGNAYLQPQPVHCQSIPTLSCAPYTVCYSAYRIRCLTGSNRNASQRKLKYWRSIAYGRKVRLLGECQCALVGFHANTFSAKKICPSIRPFSCRYGYQKDGPFENLSR